METQDTWNLIFSFSSIREIYNLYFTCGALKGFAATYIKKNKNTIGYSVEEIADYWVPEFDNIQNNKNIIKILGFAAEKNKYALVKYLCGCPTLKISLREFSNNCSTKCMSYEIMKLFSKSNIFYIENNDHEHFRERSFLYDGDDDRDESYLFFPEDIYFTFLSSNKYGKKRVDELKEHLRTKNINELLKWNFIGLFLLGEEQTEQICIQFINMGKKYHHGYPLIKYVHAQTQLICETAIKKDLESFDYIKNKTDEIALMAISKNPEYLKKIKNPSPFICLNAINGGEPYVLKYIKNQTLPICVEAILKNPHALEYVKNQNDYICLKAIEKNIEVVSHIRDMTDELYWKIHKINRNVSKYVKRISYELALKTAKEYPNDIFNMNNNIFCKENNFKKMIDEGVYTYDQGEEIGITAVQQNGFLLGHVPIITMKVCIAAMKQNGMALKCIVNHTVNVILEAVRQNGLALELAEIQTDEICKEAVRQNGEALKFVKKQTDDICKEAINKTLTALKYVNNQTEELCMRAIKQDWKFIEMVHIPTDEMICMGALQNPRVLDIISCGEQLKKIMDMMQQLKK